MASMSDGEWEYFSLKNCEGNTVNCKIIDIGYGPKRPGSVMWIKEKEGYFASLLIRKMKSVTLEHEINLN